MGFKDDVNNTNFTNNTSFKNKPLVNYLLFLNVVWVLNISTYSSWYTINMFNQENIKNDTNIIDIDHTKLLKEKLFNNVYSFQINNKLSKQLNVFINGLKLGLLALNNKSMKDRSNIIFLYKIQTKMEVFVNYLTQVIKNNKYMGSAIITKTHNVFNLYKQNIDTYKNAIPVIKIIKKYTNIFTKNSILFKPILLAYKHTIKTNSLLRKQKIYTKSKYSRSRQYCKNIVLFGLLLNIILMFGLNSSYYAILINLAYFIYPIYIFLTISSVYMFVKYKLYCVHK